MDNKEIKEVNTDWIRIAEYLIQIKPSQYRLIVEDDSCRMYERRDRFRWDLLEEVKCNWKQ